MTNTLQEILKTLSVTSCATCGTIGQFCLEDEIRERRTWEITLTGVFHKEDTEQLGTEPYCVACRNCGSLLDLDADDIGELIDDKDSGE